MIAPALGADLRAVGVDVADLYDLVNTGRDYAVALPVLLDWLTHLNDRMPGGHDRDIAREGLIRALTVVEGRPSAAPVMVCQFRGSDADAGRIRWALGNALGVVADDTVIDDVIALFTDRRWGADRQMIADALGRSLDPRAAGTLVSQLDDETVNGHAVAALGRLRRPPAAARPAVEELTHDPRAFVRKAARRTLAKLPRDPARAAPETTKPRPEPGSSCGLVGDTGIEPVTPTVSR